jgi:hypothetical protein
MDEHEADYLRQQIHELRQAKGRWQALAIISLSVLALLILAGGATVWTGGLLRSRQLREEAINARKAELEAQMQAEQARDAERAARMRAAEAARNERGAEPGK